MKKLNKYFATLLVWVLASLFVIFASGCESITSKEFRLEPLADDIPSFSMNIGLQEEDESDTKLPFVSIPEEISLNKNDEIIFLEDPVLKSQLWAAEGWKNMKRGAEKGVTLGLITGLGVCGLSLMVAEGCNGNVKCYSTLFLICGGGLVGGPSAGLVTGGILGPIFYPLGKKNYFGAFSSVQQAVIQSTWGNLVKMGQIRQPRSLLVRDRLSNAGYETFEFGLNERPFDSFVQIEPIQFRFVHVPFWASEQLTLRIVIKIRFLDENKDVIFKERIQIDEGPYTLVEWSGEEGLLLNTYMEKAYQELAEQIVASIQANNTFLLNEVKASH